MNNTEIKDMPIQDFSETINTILREEYTNAHNHTDCAERINIIESMAHSLQKRDTYFKKHIPKLLIRRWAKASLNASLFHIKKARNELSQENYTNAYREVYRATRWLGQVYKILQIRTLVQDIEKDLHHYHIEPKHIRKGDIILSYKTKSYLRRAALSRFIATLTNSQITHSLVAITDEHIHDFLSANPESHGLGVKDEKPRLGELYLVFRINKEASPVEYQKIVSSIDTWTDHTFLKKKNFDFAELKSWVACVIGFVYAFSSYILQRPICLKNPIKNKKTIFCSEVVDLIFRQSGIFLTPRSEMYAVVGPSEFFFSPYLSFKGVIANEEDLKEVKQEVAQRFMLTFLSDKE